MNQNTLPDSPSVIATQEITLKPNFKVQLLGPVDQLNWALSRIGEFFMGAADDMELAKQEIVESFVENNPNLNYKVAPGSNLKLANPDIPIEHGFTKEQYNKIEAAISAKKQEMSKQIAERAKSSQNSKILWRDITICGPDFLISGIAAVLRRAKDREMAAFEAQLSGITGEFGL